jgi:hypothetical protein
MIDPRVTRDRDAQMRLKLERVDAPYTRKVSKNLKTVKTVLNHMLEAKEFEIPAKPAEWTSAD